MAVIARSRARNRLVTLQQQETPPHLPARLDPLTGGPRSEHCQHRKNSCLPCVFYTAIPPRETARYFGISQNAVTTRVPRLRDKLKLLQEPKGGEL